MTMLSEGKPRILPFADPAFSDLTLKFGDQTRLVHKVILCNKSGWFTTALLSGFEEENAGEIVLEEDDANLMHALLDWCYHGDLNAVFRKYNEHASKTFRARLFQVADKYDVPTLKSKIEDGFGVHLGGFSRNMPLLDGEEAHYSDVAKALKILYEMPESAARHARRRALLGWRDLLREVISEDLFQDLITERPELARDILKLMGDGKIGREVARYKCWKCERDVFVERRCDEEDGDTYNSSVGKCPWCPDQWMDSEEEDGHVVL